MAPSAHFLLTHELTQISTRSHTAVLCSPRVRYDSPIKRPHQRSFVQAQSEIRFRVGHLLPLSLRSSPDSNPDPSLLLAVSHSKNLSVNHNLSASNLWVRSYPRSPSHPIRRSRLLSGPSLGLTSASFFGKLLSIPSARDHCASEFWIRYSRPMVYFLLLFFVD